MQYTGKFVRDKREENQLCAFRACPNHRAQSFRTVSHTHVLYAALELAPYGNNDRSFELADCCPRIESKAYFDLQPLHKYPTCICIV